MAILNLNEIKKHLNIDNNFTDDDDYISGLINVVEIMVVRHLDYNSISDIESRYGAVPTPIIHAMKLLIGNLYMNRESVSVTSMNSIPNSYEYLLSMYKNRENYKA